MKKIQLTQNKFTLVDNSDYDSLKKIKWFANKFSGIWYAAKSTWKKGKRGSILMHRVILKAKKGQISDHKNGNGLDNRKKNLRLCSTSQNVRNRSMTRENTSGFKGVSWSKRLKKWEVQIVCNYKKHYIGFFVERKAAAKAYDKMAIKLHGEFAKTNKMLGLI